MVDEINSSEKERIIEDKKENITEYHPENKATDDQEKIIADNHPEQSSQQDNSSKFLLVCVIGIIVIIAGVAMYNKYFLVPKIVDFQSLSGQKINSVIEDSYTYNNVDFNLVDGLWYFTMTDSTGQPYNIPLHYGPREVVDVPLIGMLDSKFNNDTQVYITFEPEEGTTEQLAYVGLAFSELSFNLNQAIHRKTVAACTANISEGCINRPIITCENTKDKAVIFLKYADKAKVELSQNCIIISGKEKALTKAVDRLLLYWYGVLGY